MSISRRQNTLLDFVIREYVKTAKPIPSVLVYKKSRLHVSPATIRTEMNQLEEQGYLEQRHTSGGRVPTDKAYRYFVNNLLASEQAVVPSEDQRQIRSALVSAGHDPRLINKKIAEALSRCSDNLVITGINEESDFFKIGLSSLFEMPEFKEFDRMFQLTSFFDQFDKLFQSFEQEFMHAMSAESGRFSIFIGRENPSGKVQDETVMVAQYQLPGNFTGSLTLIGPTRMNYEKNIALIRYTTQELEKINNKSK
jgi:heat-inducible transcriptional repressor